METDKLKFSKQVIDPLRYSQALLINFDFKQTSIVTMG